MKTLENYKSKPTLILGKISWALSRGKSDNILFQMGFIANYYLLLYIPRETSLLLYLTRI